MAGDRVWQNRQAFEEKLDALQQQNSIGENDRDTLLGHFDRLQREISDELALVIKPEYERRVAEDGADAAQAWMALAGEDLGRRAGEKTRAMILDIMERAREAA